ncbi:MAG: hypothetical protein LBT35_03765 [Tannerella sp.]|jgi:hypothetical protein|nr:hypothetical protein [Tannerella sp.]
MFVLTSPNFFELFCDFFELIFNGLKIKGLQIVPLSRQYALGQPYSGIQNLKHTLTPALTSVLTSTLKLAKFLKFGKFTLTSGLNFALTSGLDFALPPRP